MIFRKGYTDYKFKVCVLLLLLINVILFGNIYNINTHVAFKSRHHEPTMGLVFIHVADEKFFLLSMLEVFYCLPVHKYRLIRQ